MGDTYSTQFLLLFSQMVHEACIIELQDSNFESILAKLNSHPLVQGALTLDAHALHLLYLQLVQENDIDIHDVGSGVKGKKLPNFATKLCEIYYINRVDELTQGISDNSKLFSEQLEQLETLT